MTVRSRGSVLPCGCLVAAVLCALLLGAGLANFRHSAWASSLSSILSPAAPVWSGTEPVTFLLLGTDQRQDESGPSRSDTIMLALFDPQAKAATLLSIPRDLWVTIPGHGEGRINTAFFLGQAYDVAHGGPGLAALTVEQNFGVPVDYWATLDFAGFARIIDALGGVTVEVPYDIYDPTYPDDANGTIELFIPAGTQNLNGDLALKYARTRHGDSDFDRARRQQQIVYAARDRVLTPGVLPRLPSLARALEDTVETNAGAGALVSLAGWATKAKILALDARVLDRTLASDYITGSGAQVLLPNWDGIHALVSEMFAARLPQGQPLAGVSLRVENATNLPGLASLTAERLTAVGAAVNAVADRDSGPLDRTMLIVYSPSPAAEAYLMDRFHLDGDRVVRADGAPPETNMTLVLGWDVIAGE